MPKISDTYRRSTSECEGGVILRAHQDQGEGAHRWWQGVGACHHASCTCPVCERKLSKERAERVRGVFEELDRVVGHPVVPILGFIFTLPDTLREQPPKVFQTLRRRAREVATGWLAEVNPELGGELDQRRTPGWMFGGMDLYHPEGDKEPGKFHPHVVMEIAGFAFHRGTREWRRLRLLVPKGSLDSLRRRWGDVLAEVLGWEAPDHSKCDASYSFRASKRKRAHRVRYDTRHWPQWEGGWRRVTWWGFLSSRSKAELDLQAKPKAREERDHDPKICPRCGLPGEWDTCVKGKLLDRLFKGRLGKVPEAPPWFADAVEVHLGEGA